MVLGKQRSKIDNTEQTSSPEQLGEDVFLESEAKIPGALDRAIDKGTIEDEIANRIELRADGEVSASITRAGIILKGTAKRIAPLVVPIVAILGITYIFSSPKSGSPIDLNRVAGALAIVSVTTTHMVLHRKS